MGFNRLVGAAALVAILVLGGCDTAEERAEKHYQNAVALLEEGDVPRALIEFRNVFRLNGAHRQARATFARTLLSQGDLSQAFSQYLRLVEQYPDDLEGRLMLSEMGILLDNWDAAEVHGAILTQLAPDAPRSQVVQTALAYRSAVIADDAPLRREIAAEAQALKSVIPDSIINRTMIIDNYILDGDDVRALEELDEVQELAPRERRFYQMRLSVLSRQDDQEAIEALLKQMLTVFPEDDGVGTTLIRFYESRGDVDGAEEFLRSLVIVGEPDDEARITLVRFLNQTRGPDAALAETERFIEEGTNDARFRTLRATLLFDRGDREEAIKEVETVLQGEEDSEQTRQIKVTLARMLNADGNSLGARALVEEVLAVEPGMVDALKMQAIWLIQADQADDAIVSLRRALNEEPNDAEVLTIMAEAHLRNGDRDLAGEVLSLAVDAANKAPAESLRYAQFLFGEERYAAAETVLIDALRLTPDSRELLVELGRVYVQIEDWPRTDQVERALRSFGDAESAELADRLRVAMLRAQRRDADTIAFLEDLVSTQEGYRAAEIAIVRAHLEANDYEAAKSYIDELLTRTPGDQGLRFLSAAVSAATGDLEAAEEEYRALLAEDVASERIWLELVRIMTQTGREDEAQALLEQGLIEIPEGSDLMWMRATFLERRREFEAAIAIYEELYAQNTATSVIANNLASLLSTARTDEESLERAWRIARRLRDSDFPPYQDTYGWIVYRRGDYVQALRHLEPAARGLPDDPLVQYHLGMTYYQLGRHDDALTQLNIALERAGEDPRDAFEIARATIDQIETGSDGNGADVLENLPQGTPGGVVSDQ